MEFQSKPIPLPGRERRKLISRLETFGMPSPESPFSPRLSDPSKRKLPGVPNTIQSAFIDSSFHASTAESLLTYRKIQDIPKSMYRKYSNHFLHVKSGIKNPTKQYNHSTDNLRSETPRQISMGSSAADSSIVNIDRKALSGSPRESTISNIERTFNVDILGPSNEDMTYKKHKGISNENIAVALDADIEKNNSNGSQDISITNQLDGPSQDNIFRTSISYSIQERMSANSIHYSSEDIGEMEHQDDDSHFNENISGSKSSSSDYETTDSSNNNSRPSVPAKKVDEKILGGVPKISHPSATEAVLPVPRPFFGKEGSVKAWWNNVISPRHPKRLSDPEESEINPLAKVGMSSKNLQALIQTADSRISSSLVNSSLNLNDGRKSNFLARFIPPAQETDFKNYNELVSTYNNHMLANPSDNSNQALITPVFAEPPVIRKEGHIFHQLVPFKDDREADIEDSDNDESDQDVNLVDRFHNNSDSDDNFSKSDMSAIQEFGTFISPAWTPTSSGRRVNNRSVGVQEVTKRRPIITGGSSPTKHDFIKESLNVCNICRDMFHEEKILMCEHCHLQIHATCLHMTEETPCPAAFNEDKIRTSFFYIFTSLYRNYRLHLRISQSPVKGGFPEIEFNSTSDVFKIDAFLSEFDSDTRVFSI